MKILTTPWKNDLLELVANAKHSIKITSPFVKEEICREIIDAKKSESDFELITSFKLMSIYSGSLDLSALEIILSANGTVKNFSKLHSKVYLFDDEKAVITSGNLTSGGLLRNYEYGLLIDDKSLLSEIQKDFKELSDNVNTGTIKKSDLESVKNILTQVASY
jgi:phosphatidylserine/phosphatidylglycerophosphate/cardiolipin synthase-like enzyme